MQMNNEELISWEKKRKEGASSYVLKTSFVALLFSFIIYFFGNAYQNRERLDMYVNHFINNLDRNLTVLLIGYILLLPITYIVWRMNQARYKKTIIENDKTSTEHKQNKDNA